MAKERHDREGEREKRERKKERGRERKKEREKEREVEIEREREGKGERESTCNQKPNFPTFMGYNIKPFPGKLKKNLLIKMK